MESDKVSYNTLSICSFSEANSDTEPNTSLNSLRYRLERSMLPEEKTFKIKISYLRGYST